MALEAEGDDAARSRQAISDALQHVLGNTCKLVTTTTSFRWNVVGPQSLQLRALFATQGEEMSEAREGIARRIRALGHFAVANFTDEVVVPLVGASRDMPMAAQMTAILAQGHAAMCGALEAANDVAVGADDAATALLLARRSLAHEDHLATLRGLAA